MAQRRSAEPLSPWVGDLPVLETALDNGLRALILPRRQSPVVVVDLYYPAGAVHEPPGKSGLAHFVEHLLFKGTEKYPKGAIDLMTLAAAGQSNAETSEDFTHYWFELPSDRWELALDIEADRMTSVRFDPEEIEAERQVIAEERSGDLDTPQGRLDRQFQATCYLVHPYRNPVIGWPDDLARIRLRDLQSFYEAHYRPENAILVVVGDIDPEKARDAIVARFGGLRNRKTTAEPEIREPKQQGKRAFTVEESDGVPRCLMGWHTIPAGHPDAPALYVAAEILGQGRRSRLWDRLVERDRLVNWIESSHETSCWASQFVISAEATLDGDPVAIESAIREELATLATVGPEASELARTRRRLEAAWRWGQQDLAALAAGLGQAALLGDWRRWRADQREAMTVDEAAVRRVVSSYLIDRLLTVGWSLPAADEDADATRPDDDRELDRDRSDDDRVQTAFVRTVEAPGVAAKPAIPPPSQVKLTSYRPQKSTISNGLRVITETRSGSGVAALELYVDAGVLREAKPGLSFLTGRMLEEGAAGRDGREIAEMIEDIGGSLAIGGAGISLRVNSEDLPLAIEVMSHVLQAPEFPEEVFAWTKRRIASELKGDQEDGAFRAELAFRGLIYGDHPFARDSRGTLKQIQGLTLEDVREHHRRWFVPNNAILAAAGDIDRARLRQLLQKHFRTWLPQTLNKPAYPAPPSPGAARSRRLRQPGEQVHLLLGHLGITRTHPDFAALAVLDQILGAGVGFSDRLNRVLREEMGLAYSVSGGIADSADREPGLLRIAISTSPDLAKAAVKAAVEQLRAIRDGDFSAEEVQRAVAYLSAAWVFEYQTDDQRAERLADLERLGLPLDEPLRWPERVERLELSTIRAAARVHLRPESLIRVEAGPLRRRG